MRTPLLALLVALAAAAALPAPALADPAAADTADTNADLIRYYRRRANYRAVEKDVLGGRAGGSPMLG